MSEKPHVDFFETNLPDLLLHQAGVISELREDSENERDINLRWDEGIAGMQWILSRFRGNPLGGIPLMAVLGMLDEIVVYANVGTMPVWLENARRDMGRTG